MSQQVTTAAEWLYGAVDVADNSTVVYAGPALVRKVIVETVLSAHACPVQDNTTAILTIPASTAAATVYELGDVRFETNITVDPNDAATGRLIVVYKPFHDGQVA